MTFSEAKKQFEMHATCFYIMCNDSDKHILESLIEERVPIETYTRLILLSMCFQFCGVYLQLFGILENQKRMDEFFASFDSVTFHTLEKWMLDLIDDIQDSEYKQIAIDAWEERKEFLKANNYNLKKLR